MRGRAWLTVAGALLVLLARPSSGLEFGSASVDSKQGEPLDATLRIFLAPGEQIDNDCLSVAGGDDVTHSGTVPLDDAKLTLVSKQGPIRITTSTPVTRPTLSLALQAQCSPGPAIVRTVDLYLRPVSSSTTSGIDPALPGANITVKPGDSLYKLARVIYPHNETAVRDLVRAIVLANPASFPDGRARPLRIGEQLTIPDLRTVQQIIAASGQPDVQRTERTKPEPADGATAQEAATERASTPPQPQAERRKRPAEPEHMVLSSGKLRLKLSTSLDLSRLPSTTTAKPVTRSPKADTPAMKPPVLQPSRIAAISARIDRLRKLQDELDARISRLEVNATALQKVFVHAAALQPPRPPSSRQPVVSPTTPVPPRQTAVVGNRRFMSLPWQWIIVGGLLIILGAAALLLVRMIRKRRAMSGHRRRIDAMLAEARTAATPLLDTEPTSPVEPAATETRYDVPFSEAAREYDSQNDYNLGQEVIEDDIGGTAPTVPASEEAWLDVETTASGFDAEPSVSDEVPVWLRLEMDKAMDTTRSMFSDVDRFITLGRVENAISLLEFQIKRDPRDRNAWIKLMAVYRDRGLDDIFDRTYAAFREQFGDGPR